VHRLIDIVGRDSWLLRISHNNLCHRLRDLDSP
jgi:hypothetical protein